MLAGTYGERLERTRKQEATDLPAAIAVDKEEDATRFDPQQFDVESGSAGVSPAVGAGVRRPPTELGEVPSGFSAPRVSTAELRKLITDCTAYITQLEEKDPAEAYSRIQRQLKMI